MQLADNGLPEDKKNIIKLSERCLTNFKKQWGLNTFRSHGEGRDAYKRLVKSALPTVREFLKDYSRKNIFYADECELFFRMAQDNGCFRACPRNKKDKTRSDIHALLQCK